jgi:asparagine synthase (glutamine-hydrolysing)
MCGIAGYINFDGTPADAAVLEDMIGALAHRGPDEHGVYTGAGAGLAHARLSIIDLSGGRQPMASESGSLHITFNGEIFNYLELRAELIRRGRNFRTNSDTEVLLRLYEEGGEDCLGELNGQWAFAIWDERERRLFLSRDRLGVRPLFYAKTPRSLIFASEIKAIFMHPEAPREFDPVGLDEIFTLWGTVPPRTAFRGVYELPPGHSAVVKSGEMAVRRYWALDYTPEPGPPRPEGEYVEELQALLADAVRLRLRSDVPVGAYLSGGLDSTLVAALVKRSCGARFQTFSIAFDDPEFDESAYQNEAARFLDTEHEQVRLAGEEIASAFPEVVWHAEKPILRTAPAPLYLLSRLVRRSGYKVVLTGEGADEMFGGYDIFKEAKIRRFCAAHPDSKLRPLLLKRLYPYLKNIQAQPLGYLNAFFQVTEDSKSDPFLSHRPRWELTSRLKLFYSDEVKASLRGADALAAVAETVPESYFGWDWLARAQYLEASLLLPGYILSSQGDRMAMAHSVEARFPFLDHRVARFAAKLPAQLKLKALNEKYILKRAAGGLVPPAVARRKKQPYRAPEASSFFSRSSDYVTEMLSAARIRSDGIFDAAAVERLSLKVRQGGAIGIKDNMALVGILSTSLLLDQFINHFRGVQTCRQRNARSCASS